MAVVLPELLLRKNSPMRQFFITLYLSCYDRVKTKLSVIFFPHLFKLFSPISLSTPFLSSVFTYVPHLSLLRLLLLRLSSSLFKPSSLISLSSNLLFKTTLSFVSFSFPYYFPHLSLFLLSPHSISLSYSWYSSLPWLPWPPLPAPTTTSTGLWGTETLATTMANRRPATWKTLREATPSSSPTDASRPSTMSSMETPASSLTSNTAERLASQIPIPSSPSSPVGVVAATTTKWSGSNDLTTHSSSSTTKGAWKIRQFVKKKHETMQLTLIMNLRTWMHRADFCLVYAPPKTEWTGYLIQTWFPVLKIQMNQKFHSISLYTQQFFPKPPRSIDTWYPRSDYC